MLKTDLSTSIDKIYLSLSNEFKTKYSKLKETFEKEQKNVADWTIKVVSGNVKEMEQMNVLVNKINQEIKDKQSNFVYQAKEIEKSLKKRIDGVNNSSEYEFDENEADSKYEEEMNKRENELNVIKTEKEKEIMLLKEEIESNERSLLTFNECIRKAKEDLGCYKFDNEVINEEIIEMKAKQKEISEKKKNVLNDYKAFYAKCEVKKNDMNVKLNKQRKTAKDEEAKELKKLNEMKGKLKAEENKLSNEKKSNDAIFQKELNEQMKVFDNEQNKIVENYKKQLEKETNDVKREIDLKEKELKKKYEIRRKEFNETDKLLYKERSALENDLSLLHQQNVKEQNEHKLMKQKEENEFVRLYSELKIAKEEKRAAIIRMKKEKERADINFKKKMNLFMKNINNLYNNELLTVQERLDVKYQQMQEEKEKQIALLQKNKSESLKRIQNNMQQRNELEIYKIRVKNVEIGEIALVNSRYKVAYDVLINQYDSIKPPVNKSFVGYDKTLQKLESELATVKTNISNERTVIMRGWKEQMKPFNKNRMKRNVKKGKELYFYEINESERTVEKAEVRKQFEILMLLKKIEELRNDISKKIEKKNHEIDEENVAFSLLLHKTAKSSKSNAQKQKNINEIKFIYKIEKEQIEKEIANIKHAVGIKREKRKKELKSNIEVDALLLEKQEKVNDEQMKSLRNSSSSYIAFYDEKISVCEEKLRKIMHLSQVNSSRVSESERPKNRIVRINSLKTESSLPKL